MVANITAVLTVSIQSCRYIDNFFSQVSEAPVEVQQYQVCLRALSATFCELRSICDGPDATIDSIFPSDFDERLLVCKRYLAETTIFVDRLQNGMERGKLIKSWSRAKYALFVSKRLKRSSNRLQTYQTTFTLDLITIQT